MPINDQQISPIDSELRQINKKGRKIGNGKKVSVKFKNKKKEDGTRKRKLNIKKNKLRMKNVSRYNNTVEPEDMPRPSIFRTDKNKKNPWKKVKKLVN